MPTFPLPVTWAPLWSRKHAPCAPSASPSSTTCILHFQWCWYPRAISAIGRDISHEIPASCNLCWPITNPVDIDIPCASSRQSSAPAPERAQDALRAAHVRYPRTSRVCCRRCRAGIVRRYREESGGSCLQRILTCAGSSPSTTACKTRMTPERINRQFHHASSSDLSRTLLLAPPDRWRGCHVIFAARCRGWRP
jgi:hypothetical protein